MKIVDRGSRHYCVLPGAWRRWRLGLGEGAVIECEECGRRWQRTENYAGASWSPLGGEHG